MKTLSKIIAKNFKLLIRSKSSALIIILGPLLVIFLVGIAFDNLNQYSLNIGTYSEGYTELTESFMTKLQDNNFRVQKIDSEEECIDMIKQGKVNTCITFPADLSIESDKVNEITFHVDNSKINLVWTVLETISSKLSERSSELSMDLTAELLKKVELTKDELYKTRPAIVNLRTEGQQNVDKINAISDEVLSVKIVELRQKQEEIKADLLVKVAGAESTLNLTKTKVANSNASESQKTTITARLNEVNTYITNIRSRLDQPSESNLANWNQMIDIVNEVDTRLREDLNSIKATTIASKTKIDEIQASVDKIYNEVSSIKVTDATTIVNPITTVIKPVTTEKSYLNYLFPSLVMLVIMFISILLSNTLVMMEKHSPAYFRNFITPTRDIVFILATYLTNVILVFFQLAIILGISAYFFKAQVLTAIPTTFVTLLLAITFFTFIGMIIGYLFTSEETSTLAAISIGSIFLFLSNVILPLETMPAYIRDIAQFNPFVLGENLLRKAIIFQSSFSSLAEEMLILLGYSVILLFLIWLSQRAVRKHFFHRLAYKAHKKAKKKKAKAKAKSASKPIKK